MEFKQEMPPEGGYREFNWRRTYPKLLWKPKVLIPIAAFCGVYGYFQNKMHIRQLTTEKFHDIDILNSMEPFLTAERDREWLKIMRQNRDIENELMKDVPGWKTGTWYGEPVYFTLGDRWFDPWNLEVYAHSKYKRMYDDIVFKERTGLAGPKRWKQWLPENLRDYIW